MPAFWALWLYLDPDLAQPWSTCPGEGQRRPSGSGAWRAVESLWPWAPPGLSLRAQAPGSPLVSLPGWLVFIDLGKMAITD